MKTFIYNSETMEFSEKESVKTFPPQEVEYWLVRERNNRDGKVDLKVMQVSKVAEIFGGRVSKGDTFTPHGGMMSYKVEAGPFYV